MLGYPGQHVEEALQSVAVTGRKQKNQELEGMLLVCSCQRCGGKKGTTLMSITHLKLPQKTRPMPFVRSWSTCAPHTRCWWRLCRALLSAAGQACLWGTLSIAQPHHGRCAPRPNEPPIPGQIPCEAGRDFLLSQILINSGVYYTIWGSPDEPIPAVLAFWNSQRGKFQLSVALNQNVDSVLVPQQSQRFQCLWIVYREPWRDMFCFCSTNVARILSQW